MALRAQGCTIRGIARELSISNVTVQKFVHVGAFPERAPKARGLTPLDPYRDYIEERIAQGCRFPELIWQELKQRGHTGSRAAVQNCEARLLFPQGKIPLLQAPVRTMPCPSSGACSDGLSDGGSSPSRNLRAPTTSASCRRCARSNPWWAKFAASRGSFSDSCIGEVRGSSIDG